ncbi:MAG: alpha/beta hydrolase fold protein [Frankiales bacterium]|jgi:pimeloyl-ACP methyl ester carboxylesterase|nr:alpha/beta hydrolase fold protein [Frankiales bacterium]
MDLAAVPPVPGVTHRQVEVGGLSVHVAEAGRGEPLVLLHGWPQHWYCWRHVVPLLAGSYRLVMPDLRGHGWTDARAPYDKEQLATDLLGLLNAMELPRVGLVGHDWGGWTGFLACLRAPERFSGLLALGITHPFQRPTAARALQAWRLAYQVLLSTPVLAQQVLQATPTVVERAIRAGSSRQDAFTAQDLRAFGAVLQEPDRARASVLLYRTFLLAESPAVLRGRYLDQRLTVPTRLVVGDGDPVATGAVLEGWEPYAEDMTVEVLPGVGHFLPEEAPGEVAARVRALFG